MYVHRDFPDFSWSNSRHKTFLECVRKYYYQYYESHNGWLYEAPDESKAAYRLKNIKKRDTNPNKFNTDGTFKKENRDRWNFSNTYIKLRSKLQDIQRKQAAKRRQSHCQLANIILATGNEFFVETMNYKALQKRAKETKISEKTGRFQCKKRFGKSIANKAPALFVSILEYKCKFLGANFHQINTWTAKASQYNHETDDYQKKKLYQRWSQVGNFTVQRDLYSAFLIKNINITLDKIDKNYAMKLLKTLSRIMI
jgi:hypothetical protein